MFLGIKPTTFALLTQCSNHWATGTLKVCVGRPIWFRPLKLTFSNNSHGPGQWVILHMQVKSEFLQLLLKKQANRLVKQSEESFSLQLSSAHRKTSLCLLTEKLSIVFLYSIYISQSTTLTSGIFFWLSTKSGNSCANLWALVGKNQETSITKYLTTYNAY